MIDVVKIGLIYASVTGPTRTFLLKTYEIKYSMFEACSSFNAEVDFNSYAYTETDTEVTFTDPIGKRFYISINDRICMTGYIDHSRRSVKKNQMSLSLSGRSMLQILIDNQINNGKTYENITIPKLIDQVWADNRIITKTENTGSTGYVTKTLPKPISLPDWKYSISYEAQQKLDNFGPITLLNSEPGQSLFEFLNPILNSAGVFMYDPPDDLPSVIAPINIGDKSYFYTGIQGGAPIYTIDVNKNVIEYSIENNVEKLYSFIRVQGESSFKGDPNQGEGTVTNNYKVESFIERFNSPMKFGVQIQNNLDDKQWKQHQAYILNSFKLTINRQAYRALYVLGNHHQEEGTRAGNRYCVNDTLPYFFNTQAIVYNASDFTSLGSETGPATDEISPITLLVSSVTFKGNRNQGPTTELELFLPVKE